MKKLWISLLAVSLLATPSIFAAEKKSPVKIGLDAEFGHTSSTSAESIKRGILVAIEEINNAGGVLGGRPLELITKDNRSVPARGIENLKELAQITDLVAVFCGKFSPVVIEMTPLIHELKIPLLDPWAAANDIIDNGKTPSYAFRLSLADKWAMPVIANHAHKKGIKKIGIILPNTGWGRSNLAAMQETLKKKSQPKLVGDKWYNWGDQSLLEQYQSLRSLGAQAIVLVANEGEGSILVKEVAALPEADRLPILSHWGVTGGKFFEMTAGALSKVDFAVVQTFSFFDLQPRQERMAQAILKITKKQFGVATYEEIAAPVGLAHAYDLTHLLARAINRAGNTNREKIRDALENLEPYSGLVREYAKPFSKDRHEALSEDLVFMARYDKLGVIRKIKKGE